MIMNQEWRMLLNHRFERKIITMESALLIYFHSRELIRLHALRPFHTGNTPARRLHQQLHPLSRSHGSGSLLESDHQLML